MDGLWHGVVGGSSGSRKGGAEAAYAGRNAGGGKRSAPRSHVTRRGLRDLGALVKVQGASADVLALEDDDDARQGYEEEEGFSSHERRQLAEIEEEEVALAMAASMA